MPSVPPSSPRDRRNYFRVTLVLPVSIQSDVDNIESRFHEQSINISAGGFGLVTTTRYNPGDIVTIILQLPEHALFKARAEVLRRDVLPHRINAYRVHARFVGITEQDRELLIAHIMRFQRAQLSNHYLA